MIELAEQEYKPKKSKVTITDLSKPLVNIKVKKVTKKGLKSTNKKRTKKVNDMLVTSVEKKDDIKSPKYSPDTKYEATPKVSSPGIKLELISMSQS